MHRTGVMTNPCTEKGLNTDFLYVTQQIYRKTRRVLKVCFLTKKAHKRGSSLPQSSPSLAQHYKDEILVKSSVFKAQNKWESRFKKHPNMGTNPYTDSAVLGEEEEPSHSHSLSHLSLPPIHRLSGTGRSALHY